MKRSRGSKWAEWVGEGGEGGEPAGVRESGVRAARERASPDAGPCTSFEEVYRRHWRLLFAQISGSVPDDPSAAEDILQRVLVRLNRRIGPGQVVPEPLLPVLYALAEDEVRNHRRAVKRRRADCEPDSEIPSSKPNAEQILEHIERGEERKRFVQGIFARMRPDEVEVLRRAHLSGDDGDGPEGVADGTFRVRLHRARQKFAALCRLARGSGRQP